MTSVWPENYTLPSAKTGSHRLVGVGIVGGGILLGVDFGLHIHHLYGVLLVHLLYEVILFVVLGYRKSKDGGYLLACNSYNVFI